MEEWKDILGYEKLYRVSDMGNVKSLPRKGTKGKILKPRIGIKWGYSFVALYKNGTPENKFVHRLVIESFIGKSNLQCNHKNGIKSDNRILNLEYCTQSENMNHAFQIGLFPQGKNHQSAKLTNNDVILIRKIGGKCPQRALATLFNVNHSTIGCVLNNKTWKHI